MSDGTKKAAPKAKGDRPAIPDACIKRIAAGVAGKEIRIAGDSVKEIGARATEFVENLVSASLTYTESRGRKTLSVEDIVRGAEII
jgi:histone H3/H4